MSLDVRVDYADGLKDTDILGRSDPYCILQLGHSSVRSRTCTNAGSSPVWNEAFRFNNANEANELIITIKDSDVGDDDLVGRVVVPLQRVRQMGSESGRYPVTTKFGRVKGSLQLTLTYTPAQVQAYGQQPYQQPYAQPYPQPGQPTAYPGSYPQQQQYPPQAGYPTPQAYPPAGPPGYPVPGVPTTAQQYPTQTPGKPAHVGAAAAGGVVAGAMLGAAVGHHHAERVHGMPYGPGGMMRPGVGVGPRHKVKRLKRFKRF